MRVPTTLLLLALTLPLAGCLDGGGPPGNGDDGNGGNGGNGGDGNATARATLAFDGDEALAWVEAQVTWPNGTTRYRIPGTPGRAAVADLAAENLTSWGWTVTRQGWTGTYLCEDVAMENVVATLPGRTDEVLLFSAHYDTRPWADADPDEARRDEPVVGANDGGSGVGVLLELGRVLADQPRLNHTVRLVLYDAEDGGSPPSFAGCQENDWILGSTHYARSLSTEELSRFRGAVNVDMVGDPDLMLQREGFSAQGKHRALQDRLWSAGADLGYTAFVDEVDGAITDDHRPLQDRGVVSVDVIHLDDEDGPFPATWHTTDDTLDHVSAASLEAVGRTLERVLYDLDHELATAS